MSQKKTTTPMRGGGWGEAAGAPAAGPGWAGVERTFDVNVLGAVPLSPPRTVRELFPLTPAAHQTVVQSRQAIREILAGSDMRVLAVVGPCSIHDEGGALEYARRLRGLAGRVADRILVVMRVYFEKPRTTVGWKGLINDPHLDGSFDMETGVRTARRILLAINGMGLATGTEMLDPITPQYIADLVAWASIGARTIESQTHRQMASGLSMPVGYKNGTSGDLDIAVNAMKSAGQGHSFLGIDEDGRTAIIRTRGNRHGHLILRGGRKPNYDAASVADAGARLAAAGLPPSIMVDCSHANASKRFQNQEKVWRSVVEQRLGGTRALMGLLVESNLGEGSQPFPQPVDKLAPGVSITDECLGWEQTEQMVLWAYEGLRRV